MSVSVLVGYETRYGSTQEVAEAVAARLRECGLEVDIQSMEMYLPKGWEKCLTFTVHAESAYTRRVQRGRAGCAALHVPLAQGRAPFPVAAP